MVVSASAMPGRACDDNPGKGPFTVVGWVNDEAGQPVRDLTMILIPLTSGSGEPDLDNGVFQIDDRDTYQTRTNEDGLFVMPGVYDVWVSDTHRYQVLHGDPISYPDRNPFIYLSGGLVDFTDLEAGMVKTRMVAHPAGGVRIALRDATGQPYTGTRAVLLEAPGFTLAYSARFDNGIHERPGIPPGEVKVSILDGELAYFVQQLSHHEHKPLTDYLLRADDRQVVASVTVKAGGFSQIGLALP
jgi:hypothetical protein